MSDDTASLTRSTASGIGWTWGATAVTAGLQVLYTAIMSRLLEPADFGLMATAMVAMRFITYVSRFGLGSAVVQRKELSRDEAGTAFRLSIGIGLAGAVGSLALSGPLATLVGEADAARVLRWLSIALLLGSMTLVPEALVRRQMAFRGLASAHVASFVVGYLGVGLSMALAGAGVWSLVGATIGQTATLFLVTLALARPPLRTSRRSTRQLLTFGCAVSLTGFLEFLVSSLDTLAVGRWVGAAGLGQYSRATYLVGLPVEQATTAVARVLLPGLSQVQNDPTRFGRAVLRAMSPLSTVVIVPMLAVAASSTAIVPLVLGPGWDEAAQVLPILGAAYGFSLLIHLPAVAAEALGEIKIKLAIQTVSFIVLIAAIGVVVAMGPSLHRFATAWAAGELVRHILYWVLVFPRLGLRRRDVGARYAAAAALAVAFALPLFLTTRSLGMDGPRSVIVGAALGGTLTVGVALSPAGGVLRADVHAIRASMVRPSAVARST